MKKNLDELAINSLRVTSCEMINRANSGHSGIALGASPILYTLFKRVLRFNPKNPEFFFRDKFVLSAGHASSLLYATLNLFGYDVKKQDLMDFRKIGSRTSGHPEVDKIRAVETSTGPLGQGIGNAVGLALSSKILKREFNKDNFSLFDDRVFCLAGEGCLMEGVGEESLNLASAYKLDNFCLIYDANELSIEGDTKKVMCLDLKKKMEGIGFEYREVKDCSNLNKIEKALAPSKTGKPVFVKIRTVLGYGSDYANSEKAHGKVLSDEELLHLKTNLKLEEKEPFEFSKELDFIKEEAISNGEKLEEFYLEKLKRYAKSYVSDYEKLKHKMKPEYNLNKIFKELEKEGFSRDLSLRDYSHILLNKLSQKGIDFVGGSADLAPSTKFFLLPPNENIHYGIREHAMASISNGLCLGHAGKVFNSTFFAFSDYLKPALRMSALMKLPVLYVFSHDNYLVGEDGPTHQSVEQLAQFRAMPNVIVFRPYNYEEMMAGFYVSLNEKEKPLILLTNKEKTTKIASEYKEALKGGYVISPARKEANLTIISTGVDVDKALKCQQILEKHKIYAKVVSMPSVEIFNLNSSKYKNEILGNSTSKMVTIESGSKYGMAEFLGENTLPISVDSFGYSGCGKDIELKLEFDAETISKKIMKFFKEKKVC